MDTNNDKWLLSGHTPKEIIPIPDKLSGNVRVEYETYSLIYSFEGGRLESMTYSTP